MKRSTRACCPRRPNIVRFSLDDIAKIYIGGVLARTGVRTTHGKIIQFRRVDAEIHDVKYERRGQFILQTANELYSRRNENIRQRSVLLLACYSLLHARVISCAVRLLVLSALINLQEKRKGTMEYLSNVIYHSCFSVDKVTNVFN